MKKKINKIKERRAVGAVCSVCRSPDYSYKGRANVQYCETKEELEYWQLNGKHEFKCNSCGNSWQFGKGDSDYLRLK